jgi:type IV pilus assembly protein PilX
MQAVGARYGQYTGASVGNVSAPINPILADRSKAASGGYYWIEVLNYLDAQFSSITAPDPAAGTAPPQSLLNINLAPHVVYRITALAYGRKPGTLVVLQETYARQKQRD